MAIFTFSSHIDAHNQTFVSIRISVLRIQPKFQKIYHITDVKKIYFA